VLFTFGIAIAIYRLAALLGFVRWGVRVSFLALIGGLVAYIYLAIRLPGSETLLNFSVSGSVLIVSLIGSTVGLGIVLAWRTIVENRKSVRRKVDRRVDNVLSVVCSQANQGNAKVIQIGDCSIGRCQICQAGSW
jgi:hypothetical protein